MDRRYCLIFSFILLFFLCGCSEHSDNDLYEVRKQDFEQYTAFVGTLEAAGQKAVSPPYYGKVIWIEEEGKTVEKGAVLIKLDTTEIKSEHEGNIIELENQKNNLELFRLNGEYNEFSYKRNVTMQKISYEEALSTYRNAVFGRDTEEIEHKMLNIEIRKREIERVKEILGRYEEFVKLGYVSDDDRKSYEKDLIVKKAELEIMKNELEILKKGKAEDVIKEAEIALRQAENEYREAEETLKVYNRKREIDMQMYERDIENARERLEYTTELIEKAVIRAPEKGVFVHGLIWTSSGREKVREGFYISEGESAGFVASSGNLIVRIFVNEFEVGNIKKDDKVVFSLDCEPEKFFEAEIVNIENLAQFSERDVLKVKKIELKAEVLENDELFRPGMTVSGRIITERLNNVIFIPTNAINDGKVTLKSGRIVNITPGKSNYFHTIIEKGLEEKDVIRLNQLKSVIDFSARKIEVPEFRTIRNIIEETGMFESRTKQNITSPGRGKIQSMKEEGEIVSKGDIVASIDKSELEKEFEKLELDISLKESSKSLTISQKDKELFSLEQDILKKEKDFEIAQIEYDSVYNPTESEKLKRLERNYEISVLRLDSLKKELEIKKELSDKGYIAKEKIDELQTSYDQGKVDLKFKKIELERLKEHADPFQITKKRRRKVLAGLELEIARKKLENKKKEYDIKLSLSDKEISFMKDRIDLLSRIIESLDIKAEIDGVVVYIKVWKNGGQAKVQVGDETYQGSSICQVSQVDNILIMGKVSETDFLELKKGQKVEFYLPGFENEKYTGVLNWIGSFALNDGNSEDYGSYFDVSIEIDKIIPKFQPGMSVNFAIISDKRENVLSVSKNSVFHDENGKYVYLSDKTKKYIKTGIEDNEYIEILSGISQKDRIYSEVQELGKP